MWYLKKKHNTQTPPKHEFMDTENRLVVARGGECGVEGGRNGSKGTNFQY